MYRVSQNKISHHKIAMFQKSEYKLCCDVIMTLIFLCLRATQHYNTFFNISQVVIAVGPITLVMGKYRTTMKLGSRHCGSLVLDTEQ